MKTKEILNKPESIVQETYRPGGKLKDKIALITGGDSGIGRSVAVLFAKEGAETAIVYHESDDDAAFTKKLVEKEGRNCLLLKGDIAEQQFCQHAVQEVIGFYGKLNILVNNTGMQIPEDDFTGISTRHLRRTFEVNFYSFFYFASEAVKFMKEGSCIINTASVVAYRGSEQLIDYTATKGAVVSFTRALAKNLAEKKIRVNAVAPGPVWTPLIFETFDKGHIEHFGEDTPMIRAGLPSEIAPAFVFLASEDAAYITGQTIHVNGGEVVGG